MGHWWNLGHYGHWCLSLESHIIYESTPWSLPHSGSCRSPAACPAAPLDTTTRSSFRTTRRDPRSEQQLRGTAWRCWFITLSHRLRLELTQLSNCDGEYVFYFFLEADTLCLLSIMISSLDDSFTLAVAPCLMLDSPLDVSSLDLHPPVLLVKSPLYLWQKKHSSSPVWSTPPNAGPPKLSTSVESLGVSLPTSRSLQNLGKTESCTHAMEQEVARQFLAHEPSWS